MKMTTTIEVKNETEGYLDLSFEKETVMLKRLGSLIQLTYDEVEQLANLAERFKKSLEVMEGKDAL